MVNVVKTPCNRMKRYIRTAEREKTLTESMYFYFVHIIIGMICEEKKKQDDILVLSLRF